MGVKNRCIFCKILSGEVSSHKIWENTLFLAFLDIHPINHGHLLLIPKKHIDNVFDIDNKTYLEMFKAAQMLAHKLQKAMKSKRIGLAIEGFGVAHAHLHLVPVNKENELDPCRATDVQQEELLKIAKKIRAMF